MQTTKQLQRFYVVEVFRPQPPIPSPQGSETVSLPRGTSAFDQQQYTTRVNRARVEGTSPSTCARGLNDFLLFQAYRLWMEYPSRGKMKLTSEEIRRLYQWRSSRAFTGGADCLSKNTMTRAVIGEMNRSDRDVISDHLSVCSDCALQYRHLRKLKSLVEQAAVLPP